MRIAQLISLLGLTGVVVPGLLAYLGWMSAEAVNSLALLGTVLWFVATPLWMGKELPIDAAEVEI